MKWRPGYLQNMVFKGIFHRCEMHENRSERMKEKSVNSILDP